MAVDDGLIVAERPAPKVAKLVLNRPERLNAIGPELMSQLLLALQRCEQDADVSVVILAGSGRAFSAGGDLTEVPAEHLSASEDRAWLLGSFLDGLCQLWDFPKPLIAQVHGFCLGTASALCSCVDLVVVADDTSIGWPPPFGGGLIGPLWAYHVGARKAKEYSFQPSSTISAAEAARIGWANSSVPLSELDDFVLDLATKIAKIPQGILRLKKAAINQVQDRAGIRETIRFGAVWDAVAHTDPHAEEVRRIMSELGTKRANEYYRRGSTSSTDDVA